MIIITGARGFIGTNVLIELNNRKIFDIITVDAKNIDNNYIQNKDFELFLDKFELWNWLEIPKNIQRINGIIHLGACSDTSESDEQYLTENNYLYSKRLWEIATDKQIPFVYASSAATYGAGENGFSDDHGLVSTLKPINLYAKSKNDFDNWVLKQIKCPPKWIGLKYFNVYGPYENHKGKMSSVIYQAFEQIRKFNEMLLFKSYRKEYLNGEQKRDFIFVEDVAKISADLLLLDITSGIYNIGTGISNTFNDLAKFIFSALNKKEVIKYIDMPKNFRDKYQYNTRADIGKLRQQIPNIKFTNFENGINRYVKILMNQNNNL